MTLAEKFEASEGQPVKHNGQLVHGVLRIPIVHNKNFKIRLASGSAKFRQGIELNLPSGSLTINGHSGNEFDLWSDTAPSEILVECHPQNSTNLEIWNIWEYETVKFAWTGNSGFLVSQDEKKVVLSCSDGTGNVDFSCLIVEIEDTSS